MRTFCSVVCVRQETTKSLVTILLTTLVLLLLSTSERTNANPSTRNHEKPLQAHNSIDGAARQISAMYAKHGEWEKIVIKATDSLSTGKSFPHQELAKIYSETYRGIWYSEHLQIMGEPAGFDLHRKFSLLRKAMGIFASQLQEFQSKETAVLSREKVNRQLAISKIQRLADQGKLADAEKQMQVIYLQMLRHIFYLSASQARPFENEIAGPYGVLRAKRNEQRRATYRERVKPLIAGYSTAIETLVSESVRVANELSETSTATLGNGEPGDTAEALAYMRVLWGHASAAITRSVAVAWAFESRSPDATAKAFSRPLDQMRTAATKGIVAILGASENSVPPQELPRLIPKILYELSLIHRRQKSSMDSSIEAALYQLMGKSPSLLENSQRYTAATKEPVRWMRRYTTQQVERIKRLYPPTSSVLNQPSTPESTVQPSIYRPTPMRRRVLTPGSLTRPAAWVAGDTNAVLNRKIRDLSTVRPTLNASVTFVPQDPRHYTTIPTNFPIDLYTKELHSWLLVDPNHPALDLESTDAISSAALQEFEQVGGAITALTLEPFLARFATLPDKAHAIVPLDRLPVIDIRGEPADKVIWRVDMKPEWIAHRLFLAAPKRGIPK